MLLAIDAGNTNVVFAAIGMRLNRRLIAGSVVFIITGCVPMMTDEERYERHLKCEVLSRGEGIVRPHMSADHPTRLEVYNRDIRAELSHSARVLAKRPDDVREDAQSYLQELTSDLSSPRRKQAIQEAVSVIEDCISGTYH